MKHTKSSVILFSLRLFLYLSVLTLVAAHPGIAVSFDRIGIIQWFIIIPLMALLAFLPVLARNNRKKLIITPIVLLVLSIIASGFSFGLFIPFIAGVISFIFTYLLFPQYTSVNNTLTANTAAAVRSPWAKITGIEPFILVWICLRLLSLSRSGEEIAEQSVVLTPFILVWTAVVFIAHSAVIYLCLYPKSYTGVWKEGLAVIISSIAVLIIMLIILPPDFVRNTIISNLLTERIPEKVKPSDLDRGITKRGNGRRTLPQGEGRQSELRGLSEYDWNGRGGDSGENRQYMVKIVASVREPVYMGNVFRGQFDPVKGFVLSYQENLNELVNQRFFVTWFDYNPETDRGRERQEVFSLSTLRQKYLPYRPVEIDPTILSENTGPLRYIHQVESSTHLGDPLMLIHSPSRDFTNREKSVLSHYLEISLDTEEKDKFTNYLNDALRSWRNNRESIIKNDPYLREIFSSKQSQESPISSSNNEHLEKIIAILTSFSKYQYNLNPDDDYSIEALKNFLFNAAEGDCVEFSNTLALLGRLAGIPSRVVTGYLAAEGLQTQAHLRGLAALRAKIPVLQQFPFDHLYMVTNIHSHSWTQFFIPDYGWLDFESTAFSKPPEGMGDFNNWDVVIPLLDENRTFSQIRKFPWRAVGRTVLILVITAIILAYALRYGRELALYIGAQRGGRQGARFLYLLLLARLAADGKPIKPASKTAHEYSELFPESTANQRESTRTGFKIFADIYSEIRWREFSDYSDIDERFQLLKQEYKNILEKTKTKGLHRCFVRILSLRGLAYL